MSEMNKNEIIERVEIMLKYYAYQKENDKFRSKDYEMKFFALKNLWEDIKFNRELSEYYKKVLKEAYE